MNVDRRSPLVIALAKEFIGLVKRIEPSYRRAFWRFESEESRFGSNASFESSRGVLLVGALKEGSTYAKLNSIGRQLWEAEADQAKRFCVCLLVVDAAFDYELKFERTDMSKWRISKLDGASGIPEGL